MCNRVCVLTNHLADWAGEVFFLCTAKPPGDNLPGKPCETPTDCGCARAREGLSLDAPSLSSLVERERKRERYRPGGCGCRAARTTSDPARHGDSGYAATAGGAPRLQPGE